MQNVDIRSTIQAALTREGISQASLARRAGVSQSTVSRAMRRTPAKQSAAHRQLVSYMQNIGPLEPPPALDALRQIWDGSEAHAAALARLIFASGELWPLLGEDRADDPK